MAPTRGVRETGGIPQFAYDNANRRTSTTLPNGVVQSYGYDNANQLTSITYTKGASTIGDLQYTYDMAGRRVKVSGTMANTLLPAAVPYATYNVNNQLTSWAGTTHTYDLNGNLTYDGSKTFTWNARDQLSGLSGGVTASFAYDATGRRRSKTIGGVQTGFLYDQLNFVQELSGATASANLMVGGIDQTFVRKEAAQTRYSLTDALNSVLGLTDAAGSVQTSYALGPHGETTLSGAQSSNAQVFTGRELDAPGLYYFRARYYSAEKGRFLSEDPIGIEGGINIYAYINADPINGNDPLGLMGNGPSASSKGHADKGSAKGCGSPPGSGCGTAESDRYIPDLFPGSCSFHDACYSVVGPSRAQCDFLFLISMLGESPKAYGPFWPLFYYGVVTAAGGNAYRRSNPGAQGGP